jgi:transcriptional regulator with XRE-family HTH domain
MNIEIGQTISHLRKKCNLTQEQLANSIGVSAQAVSKWETDSSYPDINLLPVIANFFKVSTDYLLGFNLTESNKDISDILHEIRQLNYNANYQAALELIGDVSSYPINYEIEFERGEAKKV